MRTFLFASMILAAAACTGSEPVDQDTCNGAKCDTPGGDSNALCAKQCETDEGIGLECMLDCLHTEAIGHCEARKSDTVDSAQRGLVPGAIRWACADVQGVNQDDQGQEYCESFALVQPPPKTEGGEMIDAVLVGKNTGVDQTGRTATTEREIELNEEQIFWLEDNPTEVVGQCVFTSWHADVPGPLCGRDGGCDKVTAFPVGESHAYCEENPEYCASGPGLALTDEHDVNRRTQSGIRTFVEPLFRMVVGFNSNGAASSLVRDCGVVPEEEFPADELIEDDFIRGCMLTGPSVRTAEGAVPVKSSITGFGTQWRRSDSSICAATMRLHECGCGVDTDADGIADITDANGIGLALVPPQPTASGITLRGFPLGTWSGFELGDPTGTQLPANCRYSDTGDASQTIVLCDLTASELLARSNDMKSACNDKYGQDVVVHIPVPTAAVVCEPNTDNKFTDNCGAMPWVIGAENGEPTEDE